MSNLRTILEELTNGLEESLMATYKLDGCVTSAITEIYKNQAIGRAEQEIKELILGKAEILNEICLLAQEEIRSAELTRLILHEKNFNKVAHAFHSEFHSELRELFLKPINKIS